MYKEEPDSDESEEEDNEDSDDEDYIDVGKQEGYKSKKIKAEESIDLLDCLYHFTAKEHLQVSLLVC